MKMIQIEIDEEVFKYLKGEAEPLVDSPNSVLRKLLLKNNKNKPISLRREVTRMDSLVKEEKTQQGGGSSGEFVLEVLRKEFGNGFRKRPRYQMMFESNDTLIYFQNYNKESPTLWYRITEKPFDILKSYEKKGIVCLTNPAERIAYIIPIEDILEQIKVSGWERSYLEVNIDHLRGKWNELDWDIRRYLKKGL
ncbi:MAG: hypothetical protein ACYS3S_25250 [Planctomycetota bacterium]|jgi:hypothetical protein